MTPNRSRRSSLTGSESLGGAVSATAAAVVVGAYLGDRLGVAFTPPVMLAAAVIALAAILTGAGRRATWDAVETTTFAGIVASALAWLLWLARPTFFPLGSGPDLTHHLLLINYIEAHWTLVHDPGAQVFLGEMVQYTPGSHILTALGGAWSRTNGLQALHAVMSASAAFKAGFVFLIAIRVLPRDLARVPLAAMASISLFASQTYFLSSFAQYSFLAQVVAEWFAVAMLWALIVWDQQHSRWAMALAGLLGAAVFLTWPILIGPPLVVVGLLVLVRLKPDTTADARVRVTPDTTSVGDALLCVVPIAIVAGLFSIGRMDYVVIAGTGGEVVTPTIKAYGWTFLIVSSAGLLLAVLDHKLRRLSRALVFFVVAILMQAGALYVFARSRGNDPYMARKMFYMLFYAQAVGVAIAVGAVWQRFGGQEAVPHRSPEAPADGRYVLTALAAVAFFLVARPLIGAPKTLVVARHPAATLELEQAGKWARTHVDPRCVEYLVGDDNTAYWLHLAVLGNPRRGPRTADNGTYELTPALVRWLTPGGLPYAIADLRVIPTDIKDGADIVAQFGSAGVIRRKGSSSCAPNP